MIELFLLFINLFLLYCVIWFCLCTDLMFFIAKKNIVQFKKFCVCVCVFWLNKDNCCDVAPLFFRKLTLEFFWLIYNDPNCNPSTVLPASEMNQSFFVCLLLKENTIDANKWKLVEKTHILSKFVRNGFHLMMVIQGTSPVLADAHQE